MRLSDFFYFWNWAWSDHIVLGVCLIVAFFVVYWPLFKIAHDEGQKIKQGTKIVKCEFEKNKHPRLTARILGWIVLLIIYFTGAQFIGGLPIGIQLQDFQTTIAQVSEPIATMIVDEFPEATISSLGSTSSDWEILSNVLKTSVQEKMVVWKRVFHATLLLSLMGLAFFLFRGQTLGVAAVFIAACVVLGFLKAQMPGERMLEGFQWLLVLQDIGLIVLVILFAQLLIKGELKQKKLHFKKTGMYFIIATLAIIMSIWLYSHLATNISQIESNNTDSIGKDLGNWVSLPGLIVSILIVLHWFWRQPISRRKQEWNIDPEAPTGEQGPSVHWWGFWGCMIFHALALFTALTWKLLWSFWTVNLIIIAWLLVFYTTVLIIRTGYIKEWTRDYRRWRRRLEKESKDNFKAELAKKLSEKFQLLIIKIASISLKKFLFGALLGIIALIISYFIRMPMGVFILLLLPLAFTIGGSYFPHIRARFVPVFLKKPRYWRVMLLGDQYIDNGFNFLTLWPSWLPGFKIIVVDFEMLEIDQFTTEELPTTLEDLEEMKERIGDKARKAISGPVVKILSKFTVQRYDPRVLLTLSDEDRLNIVAVLQRYAKGALRDLTKCLTINDAKLKHFYQFPKRWKDIAKETDDEFRKELIQDWYRYSRHMEIKVSWAEYDKLPNSDYDVKDEDQCPLSYRYVSKAGHCIKHDEDGVFIPATFWEYLDWLFMTMVGCRLVEFEIMDITNEAIEAIEAEFAQEIRLLRKAEVTKAKDKILGEGEGARAGAKKSGELEAIAESLKTEGGREAADKLIGLIGAENAGVLFGILERLRESRS